MLAGVLDCETTGKLDPKHRIIELSIRVFDTVTGEILDNHLWRFNPERNIDAKAFAVHKITLEELKKEPVIKDKLPEVIKVLESVDLVIYHNGDSFDWPYLTMEAERNGFKLPEVLTYDTINCNFASELGKSPSLKELCWAFGVDYDDAKAHSGDYDTLVLGQAFLAMIKEGWITL